MSDADGEFEGFWDLEPDGLDGDRERQLRGVLARLEVFAVTHPDFAASWEQNLRTGADQACAELAGKRMAGRSDVSGTAAMYVPVPDEGFTPEEVFAAFGLALVTEVRRRMALMQNPGSFG